MKLISVNALQDGEKLYSSITNCKGMVLLKHGASLTDSYIEKLKKAGIYAVYVEDDYSEDMEIRPALSDETKVRLLEKMSTIQASLLKGKKTDFSIFKKMSRDILDDVMPAITKPINLVNTYAVDQPVLLHSLNVATIVAAMTGKMEIRRELAENYITAALFHDISLESMDKDTDHAHAEKTSKLMKDSAMITPTTYMPVAMHHEKFDGSGAPKGFSGTNINEGARLIAVADMYDNLIFGYGGHKHLTPYTAVEYMMSESGRSLDPGIVETFSKCVAVYPTGSTVLLNTGSRAIVVNQNEGLPTRPVVRVIHDKKGDDEVFDLLWDHTIFINELYL